MPRFNVNDLLIKPVYDVASYGEDLNIQLGTDTLTLQSITPSTSTFDQHTHDSVFTMDDQDIIISDTDTIGLAHEGDNTAFDRTYQWQADMSAYAYKTEIQAAFATNVSAYTSGSIDLDSVRYVLTQHKPDGTLISTIFDKTHDATLTALSATGTIIFIDHLEVVLPVKITNSNIIRLQIIVNETVSGTNTRQVGILPFYCYQAAAVNKIFTTSQLKFHVHPTLDHAFPVFRDQSIQEGLDYNGVTIQNQTRGISPAFPEIPVMQRIDQNGNILI